MSDALPPLPGDPPPIGQATWWAPSDAERLKAAASLYDQGYAAGLAAGRTPPAGMVLVPVEPTEAMLAAVRNGPMHETWAEGYRAMLAAAQQGQQEGAAQGPTDQEILDCGPGEEWAQWSYEDQLYFARRVLELVGITPPAALSPPGASPPLGQQSPPSDPTSG